MSDAKNDSVNNLLNEEDAGSVKLQKLDDSSDVQLTAKSTTMKNKRKINYSSNFRPTNKEKETKDPLNFSILCY